MIQLLARNGFLAAALLLAAGGRAAHAGPALVQLIAKAEPGSVVKVAAGVHHGALRIDKPLTLVGEPGAIVDGDGTGDVIRIAASNVVVRNLTIRDSGTSLTQMNAGIFVEQRARDVVIAGNRLEQVLVQRG